MWIMILVQTPASTGVQGAPRLPLPQQARDRSQNLLNEDPDPQYITLTLEKPAQTSSF